jgi:hypothetical protein
MKRSRDFDENTGAAVLLARKLIQSQGFKCRAKLSSEDRDFGHGIVVKTRARCAFQECDRTYRFSRDYQWRSQGRVRMEGRDPGITRGVQLVDEKRAALFYRLHGNGGIAGTSADTTKSFGLGRICLRADELTIFRPTPVVSSARLKKSSRETTKRPNETIAFIALKSGM